jgi:hypothetical protein
MNISKIAQRLSTKYFYHETSKDAIPYIKYEGLLPMSYGQSFVDEMGEMLSPDMFDEEELKQFPKEDFVQRTYIMTNEPNNMYYGDLLLRFPENIVSKIKKDVDLYITERIPPNMIDIKLDEEWKPLKEIKD